MGKHIEETVEVKGRKFHIVPARPELRELLEAVVARINKLV